MTDPAVQAALENDYETELSRLGSSKALYALTGGEMEAEAVVGGLADRTATAATTFDGWTEDAEFGGTFADLAAAADASVSRLAETWPDVTPADDPEATDERLREFENPAARVGGALAWTLLTDRTLAQAVGFFVGNADPQAADLFRDLRSSLDEHRSAIAEAITRVDEAAAREAAGAVIEAAYEDYVDSLESMGVKVKPVC